MLIMNDIGCTRMILSVIVKGIGTLWWHDLR